MIYPSHRALGAFFGASFSALLCAAHIGHAQPLPGHYPGKAVRVIVGSSPGGGIDIMARAVAQRLTERWGKPFVVDNRAGANGIIGIEMIANAAPDGYTLFGGASLIVTATPMEKVPFDTRKVITPVVQMTSVPVMLVTPPSLPANSVKELIALARAKPGTLSYGTSGAPSRIWAPSCSSTWPAASTSCMCRTKAPGRRSSMR